jgi:hypothetical protein
MPFQDVTLEIGGGLETYSKSKSLQAAGKATKAPRSGHRITSSTQASPSMQSLTLGNGTGGGDDDTPAGGLCPRHCPGDS